jgi:hypothetical protein
MNVEIGEISVEEAKLRLAERTGYECPGRHHELSPLLDGFRWDWTPFEMPVPPTDEEFLEQLRQAYPGRRIFNLGEPMHGVPHLTELRGLEHVGFGEFENADHVYLRHDSPRRSRRFYVELPRTQ